MALPTEGIWPCRVLGGTVGKDGVHLVARVNVELTDGPDKGRRMSYEDRVDNKSAPYVQSSLRAAGWAGQTMRTVAADLAAAAARDHATTAEVVHYVAKQGKNAGNPFAKVRGLGRDAKPLDALSDADLAEADALLGQPADDVPPVDDNDIPF